MGAIDIIGNKSTLKQQLYYNKLAQFLSSKILFKSSVAYGITDNADLSDKIPA